MNVALFAVTFEKHDDPETPYQRIMESNYIDQSVKLTITKQLENLNPFQAKHGHTNEAQKDYPASVTSINEATG